MQADDSLDLEDAIEKVVKKYPHFKGKPEKEEEEEDNKAWGERQRRGGSKISGVEAAFLRKTQDLKFRRKTEYEKSKSFYCSYLHMNTRKDGLSWCLQS